MWTCPLCNQDFINNNQVHSCHDKELSDFLNGKTLYTIDLFNHFVTTYQHIGEVKLHATKSMISVGTSVRFAYVIQLGKNFIDVVFPFIQAYPDNLCFNKIKPVPGSTDFNHHFRMYFKDDLNDEVKKYMKMAFETGR